MNIRTVNLQPEDAAHIRRILIRLNDAINNRVLQGSAMICQLNKTINEETIPLMATNEGLKPISEIGLLTIIDDIQHDIDILKDEKLKSESICEKIEEVLVNLHIEDLQIGT